MSEEYQVQHWAIAYIGGKPTIYVVWDGGYNPAYYSMKGKIQAELGYSEMQSPLRLHPDLIEVAADSANKAEREIQEKIDTWDVVYSRYPDQCEIEVRWTDGTSATYNSIGDKKFDTGEGEAPDTLPPYIVHRANRDLLEMDVEATQEEASYRSQ